MYIGTSLGLTGESDRREEDNMKEVADDESV